MARKPPAPSKPALSPSGREGGDDLTPRCSDTLSPEDRRIWTRVAGSVTPAQRKKAMRITLGTGSVGEIAAKSPVIIPPRPSARPKPAPLPSSPSPATVPVKPRPAASPSDLEPRRHRRLARERDPIEATIDLHGFGRFEAEDQLRAFLAASQARGLRAVLVITGQGRRGGGVIRASIADWLHGQGLRGIVSGFSSAHRRHGGEGAIYVTLKRR